MAQGALLIAQTISRSKCVDCLMCDRYVLSAQDSKLNQVSSPKDPTCWRIINYPVAHRTRISSLNSETPAFIVGQAFFLNVRFSAAFLLLKVGDYINF